MLFTDNENKKEEYIMFNQYINTYLKLDKKEIVENAEATQKK